MFIYMSNLYQSTYLLLLLWLFLKLQVNNKFPPVDFRPHLRDARKWKVTRVVVKIERDQLYG